MKLLLDTHVFIWWCGGAKRLRPRARKLIADADEVFVSAVTAWEIAIKAAIGKLVFPISAERARQTAGFQELPIRFVHADATRALPAHHTDPFDRLLIAQAQVDGLTLVSADRALAPYRVPTLWV